MANADDIKSLGEEMLASFEARVAGIEAIRITTAKFLNEAKKEHNKMSNELKAMLAKDEADRIKTAQADTKERQVEVKARIDEVSKFIETLDKEHAEMSKALKAKLAKDEADRVRTTQAEIKARIDEVSNFLKTCDKEHAEMSNKLKAMLAKDRADLGKTVQADTKARQVEVKARIDEVSRLLATLDKEHAEMSKALKAKLAKDEADRVRTTQAEIKATSAAWKKAISALEGARKRVGKAVPAIPKPPKKAVEVEKVLEIEKPEGKVLKIIEDHPKGIKITEIEEITDIARIRLGNIARGLINEGKVIKDGLLYKPKK